MDKDLPLVKQTAEVLFKHFNIDKFKEDLPDNDKEVFEEVRNLLIERITYLIDHDFDGLLHVLYRIDVNEQKVMESLAANPLGKGPGILADLIIERQLQKVKTRKTYKQKKQKSGDEEEERW